jgi:protoporphyrinogen oxidase
LVVEKSPRIGGLHQSFHYGPFTFDVGAHSFDTTDGEATRYVLDILEGRCRVLPYQAANYVFGQYLQDPLSNPSQLMHMPLPLLVKGIRDFAFRRELLLTDSLEELGQMIYGETFYRVLIKQPVEKIIQQSSADVHPDLARLLNVNIADRPFNWADLMEKASEIFQQRVQSWSANFRIGEKEHARALTSARALLSDFHNGQARRLVRSDQLYPAHGGFESFVLKLTEKIQKRGGRILTGAGITTIGRTRDRVTSISIDGHEYQLDWLVWSGPLKALMQLCGLEYTGVRMSSMVLYNLEVKGEPLTDYLWIECWDPSVRMSRISLPSLFRAENAPSGYFGLSVEVPCRLGDEVWSQPDQFIARVQQDLVAMGLVASPKDFLACHIERLPAAFPILTRDYKVELSHVRQVLAEVARNVVLIGGAAGRVGMMQNDQILYARRAVHTITALKAAAQAVR